MDGNGFILSVYTRVWDSKTLLRIFDIVGKMLIGRRTFCSLVFETLGNGSKNEILHKSGNVCDSIRLLILCKIIHLNCLQFYGNVLIQCHQRLTKRKKVLRVVFLLCRS